MTPTSLNPGEGRAGRGRWWRRRGLAGDRKGAAIVEFAMASMPVFCLFLGMVQWSILAYTHLILKHGAFIAARCYAVVAPGMPDAGKESDCQKEAMDAIFAHVGGVSHGDVKVHLPEGFDKTSQNPATVTLDLDYHCNIPLGARVACKDFRYKFTEKATFPNQGSAYQKIWVK